MVVRRDENEFYLGGTMPYFNGTKPFGWLQRIDPVTLETISESPNLPCGDHVWCGAIAVHKNGNIIKQNIMKQINLEFVRLKQLTEIFKWCVVLRMQGRACLEFLLQKIAIFLVLKYI